MNFQLYDNNYKAAAKKYNDWVVNKYVDARMKQHGEGKIKGVATREFKL